METITDFDRIYESYSDMVYRLAFARVKNKYDADDILQDVFVKYFGKYSNISDENQTKALLIKMTINRSKDIFSSSLFKKTEPLDENLSTEIKNGETLDAVLRLSKKYRTVIHLHYYCGYKVEEIAEILSINPSTVKSQLKRAREKLKTELEGVEF